jgi:hypothetical protein
MIGDNVISDFNDGFGLWSIGEDEGDSVVGVTSVFSE